MVREYTNKLIEALDEGMITHEAVVDMALKFMSEDDVKDMCRSNDILFDDEEDDDEDDRLFIVLGDPDTDDETSLYESDYYSEVKTWTDGYIRTGFGGWNVIEIGYVSNDDEWITFDRYEADTMQDDLYSGLD